MSYQSATATVLQGTLFQKAGTLDDNDDREQSGSIQVGEHHFAKHHVYDFMDMIECSHAVRVEGKPGVGKSFFMQYCAAPLLSDMIGQDVKIAWTQPMQLRSINDLYVRPSFCSGDLVWDLGPLIKIVEECITTGTPVLVVVDEANRIEPADQGILLPLADNQQSLWVEQIGRYFDLPPHSRVVLTGNIKGKGVYPWVEALRSRTPKVLFDLPDQDAMVKQIMNEAQAVVLPDCAAGRYGLPRYRRNFDESRIRMLCDAAAIANQHATDSECVSIRELLVCARLLFLCDPKRALPKIGGILTQHLNESEGAGRRAAMDIRGRLKMTIIAD